VVGTNRADLLDALTVALDLLVTHVESHDYLQTPRIPKRIIFVSFVGYQTAPDPGDVYKDALASKMAEHGIVLDAIVLDPEPHVKGPLSHVVAARAANIEQLCHLAGRPPHTLHRCRGVACLGGAIKAREPGSTPYYAGPLSIGSELSISVKVLKKTAQENLLYAGKESPLQAPKLEATPGVVLEREYTVPGAEDSQVPAEERVPAYRYGRQLVPIPQDVANFVKYAPDRGLRLLGFLPASRVDRSRYLKDSWIVLPDKEDAAAGVALGALAQALTQKDHVAIVRFVPRAGGNVAVCVGQPSPANPPIPAHLILNTLPFAEDVRLFRFQSFDQPDRLPSKAQSEAMAALVAAMRLPVDSVLPDATPNPSVRALLRTLRAKALHPSDPQARPAP
ncbi:hypothetical protein H632_c2038p0, partial [Helicosporidium sp. ATCC 50920]